MIAKCKRCKREDRIYAKGLCTSCYVGSARMKKYHEDEEWRKKQIREKCEYFKRTGYMKRYWKEHPEKYEIQKARAREYQRRKYKEKKEGR